ncbi:MAG: sulfurtransferase [Gemmatimonadales bacterium]
MTITTAPAWRLGLALAVAGPILSLSAQGARYDSSLVVTTAWLAAHQADTGMVLLQVASNDSSYRDGHIPGARLVHFQSIAVPAAGLSVELPPVDSLRRVFEAAGVSTESHVVLTGSPLEVSRAFFTLEYLGLSGVSVLDGGIRRWRAEHRAIDRSIPAVVAGHLLPHPRPELVVQAPWVFERLGKPRVALVDMRREDEYLGLPGAGTRGHVPGAVWLEWQEQFRETSEFSLKDRAELAAAWRRRAAPGDTVVVYCRTGHRASSGYLVARLLGYPVRLYDGSYEDWSAKGLPLVTPPTALRTP